MMEPFNRKKQEETMRKKIQASEMVEDFGLYPLMDVSAQHVAVLAEVIASGHAVPPIVIDQASMRIVDGIHRKRATVRVHGPNCWIMCDVRRYSGEAAIYRDAISMNSSHGRALSTYDRAHALKLGIMHGMDHQTLADIMHISIERVESILADKVVEVEGTTGYSPLKRSVGHMRGHPITRHQADVIRSLGSDPQLKMVRDLVEIIKAGLLDPRPVMLEALAKLRDAINKALDEAE